MPANKPRGKAQQGGENLLAAWWRKQEGERRLHPRHPGCTTTTSGSFVNVRCTWVWTRAAQLYEKYQRQYRPQRNGAADCVSASLRLWLSCVDSCFVHPTCVVYSRPSRTGTNSRRVSIGRLCWKPYGVGSQAQTTVSSRALDALLIKHTLNRLLWAGASVRGRGNRASSATSSGGTQTDGNALDIVPGRGSLDNP